MVLWDMIPHRFVSTNIFKEPMPPSSISTSSFETLINRYENLCCQNIEDENLNFHHREDLDSQITLTFIMFLVNFT
jgi:hypothetical protein